MSLEGLLPIVTRRPEMVRLRERILHPLSTEIPATPLSFGLQGIVASAKPMLLAALAQASGKTLFFVADNEEHAQTMCRALTALMGEREDSLNSNVLYFPPRAALPLERLLENHEILRERMTVLLRLIQARMLRAQRQTGETCIIVTTCESLTQPVIPHDDFARATIQLKTNTEIQFSDLLKHLLLLGYESVAEVEEPGQFAHRGGLIDIFPTTRPRPIRVEFFGDTIESMRTFDIETQRSLNPLDAALISPAHEALPTHGLEASVLLDKIDISALYPDATERWQRDREALRSRSSFDDIALYLPYLHREASVLEYIPSDALVFLDGPDHLETLTYDTADKAKLVREELIRDGDIPEQLTPAWIGWDHIQPVLATMHGGYFTSLSTDTPDAHGSQWGDVAGADLQAINSFGGRLRAFALEARKAIAERQRVVVVTNQARRVVELFGDEDILGENTLHVSPMTSLADMPDTGSLSIVQGTALKEGWHSRALALSVYTDSEIFGWTKRQNEKRNFINPTTFLAELKPDDFIVHIDHGIGRFEGLVKLNVGGVEREYLLLQYAGSDRIYLPTDQLNLITRYIGMGEMAPALNKIGGTEWIRAKERAKSSVKEIARDLLRLYSARQVIKRKPYSPDDQQPWLRELEDTFPYEETPDQEHAIADIKMDMEREEPMDRLVCGDVGYGKTEVALRAAFKAVLDQRQVAILVPTTILALQHFNTFTERLKEYPVRIELLSRFRSAKEQKAVLQDLAVGKVDIVIGTHRLLSSDVVFLDLGLMIIDEEQRFGVEHKERLKQFRTEVDVLTLTATPIPRTLHMAMVNVRDMSVIETPPQERLPIRTYIRENEDVLLREAILREIDRGGQVFFVTNRVRGIQQLAEHIEEIVPEAKVAIAHGQMNEDKLEHVMLDFASGKYTVLICTTIIENGLDIPNANTIIVNNSAFFGLSQLYQLRGRVGRATQQAYAYFLYHKGTKLTPIAERRLRAIYEATELGAGFRIAMKDLEIRGAGNLLGSEQSGNMNSVGFDLYCQLLAEEVAELQGSKKYALRSTVADVSLDIPLPAYLPDSYIPDRTLKIQFYQRMAVLSTFESVDAMQAELHDRFGVLPEPVTYLLEMVRLKAHARERGFTAISLVENEWILKTERTMTPNRVALFKRFKGAVRVELGTVWIPRYLMPEQSSQWLPMLHELIDLISTKDREPVRA